MSSTMKVARKIIVLIAVFYSQRILHPTFIRANSFCGNQSAIPNEYCHQGCYDSCVDRVAREDLTLDTEKESIATHTNLCMDKCYGIEFLPLKSEDIPGLPHYLDATNCLGRCAYPAHKKYCFEGYLSSFFYCDCHHCCLQSTDNEKCVRGCHLWFLRQWSPKPKHSCRYREELEKSPKTWCTGYCIFMTLRLYPTWTWNDVPKIRKSPCINRCMESMSSGAHIDYEMEPVPCTDILKCAEVAVFQFKIVRTSTLNQDYARTKIGSEVQIPIRPASASNTQATLDRSNTFSGELHPGSEFDVHRDSALDKLQNLGYNVFCEPGTDRRIEYPRSLPGSVPVGAYGEALPKAYSYSSINTGTIRTKGAIFKSKRKFEIDTCSALSIQVAVLVTHDFQMDHEVNVKVYDHSMVPMPAVELRNAIALKPEWSGLKYVKDLDDFTIVMKGKGFAIAKFGLDLKEEDSCTPIQGCDHPKIKPNEATACRKIQDNSNLDFSGFTIDISYQIY